MRTGNIHTDPSPRRLCDEAGCTKEGCFKAPESPQNPRTYVWLCLEHVRLHNARWNAFKGLANGEIEKLIRLDTVWERPSWPFGKGPLAARHTATRKNPPILYPAAVLAAFALMNLKPPLTLAAVKARYRALAKRIHPDAKYCLTAGAKNDHSEFCQIQQAFTTIKEYYAKKTS
ncbi:MAG TPA: hypothetical protein DCY07_01885 [Rhodospirillaceae bacterium]|nr:hypothetical protein [Rhodospirillaceae bacterium]